MLRRIAPLTQRGRSAFAILLALAVTTTPTHADDEIERLPDGVCNPVDGTGYIVKRSMGSTGQKIVIGPLTPVMKGDSLVVETGTITFVDFHNGKSSVFGQGTKIQIYAVSESEENALTRLKNYLSLLLGDTERRRSELGTVRDVCVPLWPNNTQDESMVEYAPGVPVFFAWWDVSGSLSAIRIRIDGQQIDLPLSEADLKSGTHVWDVKEKPSGVALWELIQEDEPLFTGRFLILTSEEARRKREMYLEEATGDTTQRTLQAILRALADRSHLW